LGSIIYSSVFGVYERLISCSQCWPVRVQQRGN